MPIKKKPSLKNTYSRSPRLFEDIQTSLTSGRKIKARHITFEFGQDGRRTALSFSLEVQNRLLHFRLPARYENVERIFAESKTRRVVTAYEKEQAYQAAWANIRDWLSAQMALIETEMVEPAEVFLPYLLNEQGQTYYEVMKQQQFLVEGPKRAATTIIEE